MYFGANDHIRGQGNHEVQHRIRCAWTPFANHRQEPTSQSYPLRHRLHQFDVIITPTLTYGDGTWTTTKEHEKMLRATQRRMPRLIIQTKRKYHKKNKEDLDGKGIQNEDMSEDAQEEDSTNDEYDQDSSISFEDDSGKMMSVASSPCCFDDLRGIWQRG